MTLALPRLVKIVAVIGATAAAVVSVGTVWTMFDLPVLATRGYVEQQNARAKRSQSEVIGVVVELAKDRREILRRSKEALVVRLAKTTDSQAMMDVAILIDATAQDIVDIDARISALERLLRE